MMSLHRRNELCPDHLPRFGRSADRCGYEMTCGHSCELFLKMASLGFDTTCYIVAGSFSSLRVVTKHHVDGMSPEMIHKSFVGIPCLGGENFAEIPGRGWETFVETPCRGKESFVEMPCCGRERFDMKLQDHEPLFAPGHRLMN